MSLSEELRQLLAAVGPTRECDRLAEISALFYSAGSVHLKGRGEVSVHLDLPTAAVARRAFVLLRSFGVEPELRSYRRAALEQGTRWQLHVSAEGRGLQTLHEAGVLRTNLAPLQHPPRRVIARPCCRAAYLRGALLGGGSLSGPPSSHLELRSATVAGAEFVSAVAAGEGIRLGVYARSGHAVAYTKGMSTIAELLARVGASALALGLEEQAVLRSTKSRANRLANADHANLVRASRAAHAQLQAVQRLERAGRLELLPRSLREIAELRARHPSLSVRELGLKCRPPLTKPAAYRRLKKLLQIGRL